MTKDAALKLALATLLRFRKNGFLHTQKEIDAIESALARPEFGIEQERKLFEAWLSDSGESLWTAARNENNEYIYNHARCSWLAWKACAAIDRSGDRPKEVK